jgi:type I restriction enzyme, S subunit
VSDRSIPRKAAIQLIFRELIDSRSSVKLSELPSVGGGTPSRHLSHYFDGDIPWFTVADFALRSYIPQSALSSREYITQEAIENSSAKLLPPNTVLFSTRVSIGKVAVAETYIATNQDFRNFLPVDMFIPKYLAYFLLSLEEFFQVNSRGTTIKGVTADLINNQEIPLLSKLEQHEVVDYLETLNPSLPLPNDLAHIPSIVAHIDALAARIAEARGLRQSAVEETERLWYSSLRMLRESHVEASKNRLGEITTITAGGTPPRDNPSYWNGDIPWIKTGELIDGDIFYAQEYISEAGLQNSSAKLFPAETVLIALYGQGQTRGRTARLMIEAATNQACCAILPSDKFDARFIQYWLRSLYLEMREVKREGAQPNWNAGMIKQIEISLISVDEQRRIVAYLDGLQAEVERLKRLQADTAAELDALLPSLLDRAFRGEL